MQRLIQYKRLYHLCFTGTILRSNINLFFVSHGTYALVIETKNSMKTTLGKVFKSTLQRLWFLLLSELLSIIFCQNNHGALRKHFYSNNISNLIVFII